MTIHKQRHWRLKFRVDPDAGRVLFVGPFVINFDIVDSYAKTKPGRAALKKE